MKKQPTKLEEKKAHALFSPSASKRWLNCPGSVTLSSLVPQPPETPQAREGTNAHTCLETYLVNGPHKMLSTTGFLRVQGNPIEMVVHAERAALNVWKILDATPGGEMLVEQKAECSNIDPHFYGTADVVILQHFGQLHIIDFKYGFTPVEVRENEQLIAYAIGVAQKWDFNFESVKLSIIQPRVMFENGLPVQSWVMGIEMLFDWVEKFRAGVALARQENAPLASGSHCFFCPAKSICMEYDPDKTRSVRGMFVKPPTEEERRKQLIEDFGD